MALILLLLTAALSGTAMAFVCPWLPVLLAGILLFLATLTWSVAAGEGFLRGLGSAVLAMVLLQVGYVLAGRLRESRVRRLAPMRDAPSKE